MDLAATDRLLSLAAGTVLDVDPVAAVDVAADAGWHAVGIWYDHSTWTRSTAADIARRSTDRGVAVLDIEPFIFGRGATHQEAIVEAAGAIGARDLLTASGTADFAEVVDGLGQLCDLAAQSAPHLKVVLEFLPIFSIGSLAAAADVVSQVDRANLGILVDSLHLARSGGVPQDCATLGAARFPYVQIADAPRHAPLDLRDEALNGRLLPGDGELPLAELLALLPLAHVSVELRSRQLNTDFPEPVDRARHVLAKTVGLVAVSSHL